MTARIRHALRADEAVISEILAQAFAADPVMIWLFPDPEDQPPALRAFFAAVTSSYRPHGHSHVIDDVGAALWAPPDVDPDMAAVGPVMGEYIDESRHGDVSAQFGRLGEHRPPDPHFYLQAIGVRDGARGTGLGAAMLEYVTETCDEQGLAAHLESSNPRNLSFYERHGFEVTAELEFAPGVVVRPMQRPPRR